MSAGFTFNDLVTVTRVVSTVERGAIFSGKTRCGDQVRVRYTGHTQIPVVGDTFTIKGQWTSFTDKYRCVHRQVETKVMTTSTCHMMPFFS